MGKCCMKLYEILSLSVRKKLYTLHITVGRISCNCKLHTALTTVIIQINNPLISLFHHFLRVGWNVKGTYQPCQLPILSSILNCSQVCSFTCVQDCTCLIVMQCIHCLLNLHYASNFHNFSNLFNGNMFNALSLCH